MNTKDLLYYNGFGGFEKESLTYVIKTDENNTPMPWSHMMANENFGTIGALIANIDVMKIGF